MEKYIPCKWEAKEIWSNNPHIKPKRPENKEDYKRQGRTHKKIKGSIQEEIITIVNTYAPNIGALEYIRQTLTDIKEEMESSTITAGEITSYPQWTDNQNGKLVRKRKS